MYHPNLFAGNSRSSATGLSEARPLCNYRTAWDFHLSAFLCSTAQPLGFRQLTKDNALPSLLLDYAVDGMIIHVRRQGWKEGERADFSVAQQACGECHLGFWQKALPCQRPWLYPCLSTAQKSSSRHLLASSVCSSWPHLALSASERKEIQCVFV